MQLNEEQGHVCESAPKFDPADFNAVNTFIPQNNPAACSTAAQIDPGGMKAQ
jgi:hypothetical protein